MLFEAGFVSILRTLVIIVLVYYAFKLVFRFLVPLLFKLFLKKYSGNFQPPKRNNKKEGEISIDVPPKSSTENDNLGEYVDFEEIKDKKKK